MAKTNGYGKKLAANYYSKSEEAREDRTAYAYDDIGTEDRKYKEDECLNNYYYRKMTPVSNDVAGDADAELVTKDDSFAESRNYREEGGFINYKRWDRYGKG
jgi:hypothetical protein